MNPTLVAVFGPLQGSTFQVNEQEVFIGRDPSNWLSVSDPLLSRKHCKITKDADACIIHDLDSRNGIAVNGIPVRTRTLQHGDQVQMGDSLFLFLLQDALPETGEQESPEMLMARSTTQLRIEDALYLHPEKMETTPAPDRMAHDLKILLQISKEMNSIQDLRSLERKLLELIFDVLPAERGAIVLSGDNAHFLTRATGSEQPFHISKTITCQVLEDTVALLGNDIQLSEKLAQSKSLTGAKIQSLLCAPFISFGKTLGILYLDTTAPMLSFDQNHLELVTGIADIAAAALRNAQNIRWLIEENRRLQTETTIEHGMIGESSKMKKVYEFITKIASSDSTVFITGENGTGKELVAKAIHYNSSRATQPFIAINCAALVETLLESELFGHEKGAFTGAGMQKRGKLEAADRGSVFFDEIAEMSPQLQAKLLRVLQEREFERVGGTRSIGVDIRVIAATNKNLQEAVKAGAFRQDLFYRLNVVSIEMPPLRERRDDIPLLASYFAVKYGKKFQRHIKGFAPETRELLQNYDWPGNVRELENAIERAVVLGSTDVIRPEDLPEHILEVEPASTISISRYHEGVNEAKKKLILSAMDRANGNMSDAADLLGVNLTYLYRLIRNLKLKN